MVFTCFVIQSTPENRNVTRQITGRVLLQTRRDIRAMDAAFYEHMVDQFRRGELDEEGLSDMLDEHLQQVEQFKRQLRLKLAQRRRQNQQVRSAKKYYAGSL